MEYLAQRECQSGGQSGKPSQSYRQSGNHSYTKPGVMTVSVRCASGSQKTIVARNVFFSPDLPKFHAYTMIWSTSAGWSPIAELHSRRVLYDDARERRMSAPQLPRHPLAVVFLQRVSLGVSGP